MGRRLVLAAILPFILLILVSCGSVRAADENDHSHDHDDETTSDEGAHATLEMKLLFGGSADPIRLLWTKATSNEHPELYFVAVGDGVTCGREQLEEAEHEVEELIEAIEHGEASVATFEPASTITATGAAELHADSSPIAMYSLVLSPGNCTAVFGLHTLDEYGLHFINETSGELATIAYEETYTEPSVAVSSIAGAAMGGAIIVCIIPLLLIIFCAPLGKLRSREHIHLFFHFMNAFGCGALISVVALHINPEMVIGLNEAGVPFWQGGALTLAGICSVALIHFIADGISGREHDPEHGMGNHNHSAPRDVTGATSNPEVPTELQDPGATVEEEAPKEKAHAEAERRASSDSSSFDSKRIRIGTCRDLKDFKSIHPLIWGLTIGDALHNFVDGTIIATAFIACGPAAGWTTVGATIAHEVPQELGDFSIMLSKGATVGQALMFNLISQAFALLGCGIVLAVGAEIPESQTGLLLAFGIGTFWFIALTDIMPLMLEVRQPLEYLAVFLGLGLSMTAIGLSTMGEGQCGHSH